MTPYEEGTRDGRLDNWLGHRSDYAWYGVLDRFGSYSYEYSRGYRDGWTGRTD